jgi:hypothetical protein
MLEIPELWKVVDRTPEPADVPALASFLLVESTVESGVRLEFFDWVPDGETREHHMVEASKDTDVVAFAEYLPERKVLAWVQPIPDEGLDSRAWWSARAGTYVDTLTLAHQVWPA